VTTRSLPSADESRFWDRNVVLLFAGQSISLVGDYVLFVAVPLWVFELTGSVAATSASFIAIAIPPVLLGPFAGVFVDRWDRRLTMVISDLLRAVAMIGLFAVRSVDDLWLLYALTFAASGVSQLFLPARDALIPTLAGPSRRARMNAVMGMSASVGRLIGAALGGLLFAAAGGYGAAAFNAASFAISAGTLTALAVPTLPASTGSMPMRRASSVVGELAEGLRVVIEQRELRVVFLAMGIGMFSRGVIGPLLVVLVRGIWNGRPEDLGWIISAQGVGALIAGTLLSRYASRFSPRDLLLWSGVSAAVALALLGNQNSLLVGAVLTAFVGALAVARDVGISTSMQALTQDAHRGRVSALLWSFASAATLAAAGVTAVIGPVVGVVAMFDVAALAVLLAGLIALALPAAVGSATKSTILRATG
jgi:MFS family permease